VSFPAGVLSLCWLAKYRNNNPIFDPATAAGERTSKEPNDQASSVTVGGGA
jgi:hypothetical protein